MPSPPAAWTVADLIDLEHFLQSPAPADEDRSIFDDEIAPRLPPHALDNRRGVLRAWLDARRARAPGLTAGAAYDAGRRSVQSLAVVLGFIAGAGLAGSLLAQAGEEPVNALQFLAWTVGLQWLLLALGAAAWLLQRIGVDIAPWRAVVALALAAAGRSMRQLPGERRDSLRATLARVERRRRIGGTLLAWPAFIVMQLAALAFNLGLLLAMLFVHLPFAELRFGWQSTYDFTPEQVHHAIDTIAAPWAWLAPGAQPTLADIVATRTTRGQNAQSLPSDAGRAWWPFLVFAIGCYGLLLRALLLALGIAAHRRRLARVRFDDPDTNALWRRLRGPLVGTRGGNAALPTTGPSRVEPRVHAAGASCLVLLSEEVALTDAQLDAALRERFGWIVQRVARVSIDDRRAAASAIEAAMSADASAPRAIAVVAPASRDPIVAVALFLRELTAAAPNGDVLVLLCADGADHTRQVDPARLAVWQRFATIQRLDVGIESLR